MQFAKTWYFQGNAYHSAYLILINLLLLVKGSLAILEVFVRSRFFESYAKFTWIFILGTIFLLIAFLKSISAYLSWFTICLFLAWLALSKFLSKLMDPDSQNIPYIILFYCLYCCSSFPISFNNVSCNFNGVALCLDFLLV